MIRTYNLSTEYEKGIAVAAELIISGDVVIFPTETVYGIGADAFDANAVKRIFELKRRPLDNPLIVHVCSMEQVSEITLDVSPMARDLMNAFWPGPFTAVLKKAAGVPDTVTAGLDSVAVRMPDSFAAQAVIEKSGRFIAAPSANLSGSPSPTCAAHAEADFGGKVVILDGGNTRCGIESTVCDLTGDIPIVLRPGSVTPEMIKEVAGRVNVADAVLSETVAREALPSPGMKYKHYAPSANVTIVYGEDADTIAFKIKYMYDIDIVQGKSPVIFCSDYHTSFYSARNVVSLGEDTLQIAKGIFKSLREADARGHDCIYFEALNTDGVGLAVMNRMLRAAGFKTA